jgi:predicted RNA polymerase sigma factor
LGAEQGLLAIEAVKELHDHRLYHAARGDMLVELGRKEEARDAYEKAMRLTRAKRNSWPASCARWSNLDVGSGCQGHNGPSTFVKTC